MLFSLPQLAIGAAIVGHVSHVTWFIRGEKLKQGPTIFVAFVSAPPILTLLLSHVFNYDWLPAMWTAGTLYASFISGLIVSMSIYRAFFHPLNGYPGPFLARLTQWYHVFSVINKNNNYLRLDELHRKYGEYVRVGPNLLSIADPDIVELTLGTKSRFRKSVWYSVGEPMTTLHQMRDQQMHDRRRKGWWEKAFVMKSVRQYEPAVVHHADLLVKQLTARAGQVVDSTEWINFFTFDVMGQLGFGQSFNNLQNAESHWFVHLIHENGAPVGAFGTVNWLLHLAVNLPSAINPMNKMLDYSEKCVDDRIANEPSQPDVMSHILEAGPFFDNPRTEKLLLTGDSRLLIIAGSDTTATTLAYAMYYFVTVPTILEKLRAELAQHNVYDDDSFDVDGLQHLPYLNALINETLRMHPPVPGGLYRDPPPEGITINGHFLPPSVVTVAPTFTIQRSPKAFAQPNDFIPERWTSKPELVIDKTAWFPFSTGRYGCVGKQLALIELRTVLAKIALTLDIKFAPGETGRRLMEESKDIFTMTAMPLNVIFTARK